MSTAVDFIIIVYEAILFKGTAVNKLFSIAQNFLFPEKNRDHLIQVIKLSESRGMKFDHTWVVGCHFESLPSTPEGCWKLDEPFGRQRLFAGGAEASDSF